LKSKRTFWDFSC